jgi:hypothetical protein
MVSPAPLKEDVFNVWHLLLMNSNIGRRTPKDESATVKAQCKIPRIFGSSAELVGVI